MAGALNAALRDALRDDPRVLVFGEDVGRSGGVFRVTDGLQAEFGADRVFDTPISEAGIAGAAVGLAFAGWRSVVEMQFDAFSYPALEQIVDHVAKMRERTRGRVDMPIVIRMPAFGGIKGKEHHGESPETFYVHTAGLKVVAPSSALDAYRLLRLAIADPDPVIVLEPKARYWSKEDGDLTVEGPGIGEGSRPARRRWPARSSRTARWSRAASKPPRRWRPTGIEARVVDLRSLSPLDVDLIADCVRETGRAVVVHEAPKTLGLGAEVTALIVEEAFDFLEAPGRPGHRLGRAVSAGGAGAPLPAQRAAHRGGDPGDGERTDGAIACSRCRTSARASRRARSSRGSSPRATPSR